MAKRDYYEVLEVAKNATQAEIKAAYRKKALQFHPDKNPGDHTAEDKFKEAAAAYEILGDEQKRARYDQYGHAGVEGGSGGFGGRGMTVEDIFEHFGDIFGGSFGGFGGFGGFSGGRSRGRRVNKGANLRVKVKLNLKDIANGVEKKLKVNKYVACKPCNGTGAQGGSSYSECGTCRGSGQVTRVSNTFLGQMQTTTTCPTCGGDGKTITSKCTGCYGEGIVKENEVITVNIPAGVGEGMQMTVAGQGNAPRRGGVNGDLLVVIEEEKHPELMRDGNDLIYNLYLAFPEAALGTTVEIPIVEGKAKIKIEPGMQPGKILRLRGKGLPDVNGYGKGDLLLNINVWIPKNLSKEEKSILEKLKSSKNFEPAPDPSDRGFFDRMKSYFE
jgi:molecular chaperone DnaJ